MSRDLVKAARTRASILNILNSGRPMSMRELHSLCGIKSDAEKGFNSLVYRMATNELIVGLDTELGKRYTTKAAMAAIGPSAGAGAGVRTPPFKPEPYVLADSAPASKAVPPVVAVINPPELTVDINKATGRVRITVSGITIDINVN